MKKEFIVKIILPEKKTAEYINLIPTHRVYVDKLMQDGVILSYCLTCDREEVFAVITAHNKAEVYNIVATFPIIEHIKIGIKELAFNKNGKYIKTHISLN